MRQFLLAALLAATTVAHADIRAFKAYDGFIFTACGEVFAVGTVWPDGHVQWAVRNNASDPEQDSGYFNTLADAYEKEGFTFSVREIADSIGLECPRG